jgi:hypothetical protein
MLNHRHKRILIPVLFVKEMNFVRLDAPSGGQNRWEFPKGINAQPYHRRTRTAAPHPPGKVFVFGDDHRAMLMGVPPDWSILAFGEIDIKNMIGLMPFFPQPSGQGSGQLRVNQEAHILRRLPIPDN